MMMHSYPTIVDHAHVMILQLITSTNITDIHTRIGKRTLPMPMVPTAPFNADPRTYTFTQYINMKLEQ
jgi:hypothetical protein